MRIEGCSGEQLRAVKQPKIREQRRGLESWLRREGDCVFLSRCDGGGTRVEWQIRRGRKERTKKPRYS